jgi:tRNA-(ms[2]io[6]A)-hydroxylase
MDCPSAAALPLVSQTPAEWARQVLREPLALLVDHAFLEKKAAANALEMLTRWPEPGVEGWVQSMANVARDETAHLAQVTRLLHRRGGRLDRVHKNPYANALRARVRKGTGTGEIVDRLLVAALIEARSCERFAVLAAAGGDRELAAFYQRLAASEMGHYAVFVKLARLAGRPSEVDKRWREWLALEAETMAAQTPGPRIHSGIA